ncbi:hypothetical protein GCM10027268_20070 [Brachybacterium huguangmaarense]
MADPTARATSPVPVGHRRCGTMAGLSTGRGRSADMSKRGRKRKSRRKGGANHGKRPNA